MKFAIEPRALRDLVASAARFTARRTGSMVALGGVMVTAADDAVSVAATDLERSFHDAAPATVETEGRALVPAALLSTIAGALPDGVVTVELSGDELTLASGRSVFRLRCLNADDFPRLPPPPAMWTPWGDLVAAFRRVSCAASHDDSRPILTSVSVQQAGDGIEIAATDSYRLAVANVAGTLDETALIPASSIAEVLRRGIDDVRMASDGRTAWFRAGTATISTRLIEGAYPEYRRLLPERFAGHVVVDAAALKAAVQRVKLMCRESVPVRLSLTGSSVGLAVTTADVGQAVDDVDVASGDVPTPLTVAFNPDYLVAGIDAVGAERVRLSYTDALKPCTLTADGDADGFVYLLMPVRVP